MMIKTKDNKPHIGIFGRRNNGKSSILNIMGGQKISIVSEVSGTTTDPVKKSIEIQGVGPAVVIDTAGIDDVGDIGKLRIQKTLDVIQHIDMAVLVVAGNTFGTFEENLVGLFKKYEINFFIVHNKSDEQKLDPSLKKKIIAAHKVDVLDYSTVLEAHTDELFNLISKNMPETVYTKRSLLGGLLDYGDIVLLITPIDIEAPEGRMILPQVQAIRDILDNDCVAVVLKEREVDVFLKKTGIKPKLAVTDSQVFLKAASSVPEDIPLTGFSIMLAHHKGDFENYLKGTPKIGELQDGDNVLLLESCTHHVSCDDIGRVKIPRWISNATGKDIHFDVVAGLDNLPRPIKDYSLVIQCGGCVLTGKQIKNRLRLALDAGIPVTNYGMAIAWLQGVYDRAIAPFVEGKIGGEMYL
jgi:[FeFe] hydrogenase H-cluster maturation GTPase HydF